MLATSISIILVQVYAYKQAKYIVHSRSEILLNYVEYAPTTFKFRII